MDCRVEALHVESLNELLPPKDVLASQQPVTALAVGDLLVFLQGEKSPDMLGPRVCCAVVRRTLNA